MECARLIESWPADNVAVAVIDGGGDVVGQHGDGGRVFPLASVTKLLTAYAVLVAVEEGAVEWDQPAGPEDSTVRHLIAHTSGLAFDTEQQQALPGTRRIYSNTGFAVLAETVARASGIAFPEYLDQAVCQPLGLTTTRMVGSAGAGIESTCDDLAVFAAELQAPTLIDSATLDEATSVAFPGLNGVLPGYGMQKPNDWGLGLELRDNKSPHWTGLNSSPSTFGHFGQSGTFLWVDPMARLACVALTDKNFGPWAVEAWTPFTDAVLAEFA